MRFHRSWLVLSVVGLLASVPCVRAGEPVSNLLGDFSGVFVSTAGAVERFTASYIEQDNLRRFTGELLFGTDVIPFRGTIAASDQCTCIGSGDGKYVYQARWVKFGDGAGALIGNATVDYGDGAVQGTMIQFRSFSNQRRPDVRGEYAGTFRSAASGIEGSLLASIQDGSSNTLTVAMSFQTGRTVQPFLISGDVASDGRFVGVGVAPDGTVAVVEATISGDDLDRLSGTVTLQSALGKVLDVNSIIAILIG
jgi:hypothetical protein